MFGVRALQPKVFGRLSNVRLGAYNARLLQFTPMPSLNSRKFSSHTGVTDNGNLPTTQTPLDVISQIVDTTDKIEYKSMSDLGYSVSDIAIRALDVIHTTTGLPWYATIFVTTVAVRTAMFPFTIKGMRNAEKMKAAQPELERIQAEYTSSAKTPQNGLEFKAKMKDAMARHDVNPIRGLIAPLSQIPVFLGFFWGLQSIRDYFPDYVSGGTLWFPDLSVADPTYVLPVISSMLMVASIETGKDTLPPQWGKNAVLYIRGFGVVLVPLTVKFQAGVLVYWVSSNFYTLIQTLLLRQSAVRRAFKLAPLNITAIEVEAKISTSPFSAAVARAQQGVTTNSETKKCISTEHGDPPTSNKSKATDRTKSHRKRR